jgi:hypothetical protein
MSTAFSSSWNSIEHAKKRLHEFEGEAAAFLNARPYARVVETNEARTEDTHKLKLAKPLPVELSEIAFDAFKGLRSALDQAGQTVAVAVGARGNQAHFPFGDNLVEVAACAQKGSSDIPKGIFDVMLSFKPYKGGDDLLWALNEVCNSGMREIIAPVAIVTGELSEAAASAGGTIRASWPPRWDSTKHEMVIAVTRHGAAFGGNFEFAFFMALANIEIAGGKTAAAVLEDLVVKAQNIVSAIEAEAIRTGIVT